MADKIYLPSGQASNIVKDSDGKCWELQGFQVQSNLITFEDLSTYDIIDAKICCKECNEGDYLEDLLILKDSDYHLSSLSTESSNTSSSSSQSSESYYVADEDECGIGCCGTNTISFGFTKADCLVDLATFVGAAIDTLCAQDCGDPLTPVPWELCVPDHWATFSLDTPGMWSCGFCCIEDDNSSSSSSNSSSSQSSSGGW